jgi:3-methylfumaryl-CoA hydratase
LLQQAASHHAVIGQSCRRTDVCAPSMVRRVAALLDLDPETIGADDALPHGWHFPLLAGETRRSDLREDGFPGFGLPMPDLGLPRLLMLGRSVVFHRDIPIGSALERNSIVDTIRQKETPNGPSAIVTLQHQLAIEGSSEPAISETQSYLLLGGGSRTAQSSPAEQLPSYDVSKVVTPDDTMLFQYSALGFNSHKIHLDRRHAQEVEGLPDLVVNGGVITLLLTEFLRTELRAKPRSLVTRHMAPLYSGSPITLGSNRNGGSLRLAAHDHEGRLATTMEVEVQ